MTNSIASAKCPSVLTSGNYGMSQNRCTDESKEYIFVKLTDSAYRAIEEYQRNDNAKRFSQGQRAKIQFIGNSGVIHFPTPDSVEDRKFGFAIDDVEGSLECIQQTDDDLDVLGSLSYRMRIHANDDVYDTTRTKMAIAEETEKSKCIREIKPNQTDIGRKVKKPASTTTTFQPNNVGAGSGNSNNSSSSNYLSNSSSNHRSKIVSSLSSSSPPNGSSGGSKVLSTSTSNSSRSPNPAMLGGSGTIGNSSSSSNRYGSHTSSSSSASTNTNLYSHNNASSHPSSASSTLALATLTSASSLSSTLAGGIKNGYASASTINNSSSNELIGSSTGSKSKLGSGNSNLLGSGSNSRSGFGMNTKGAQGGGFGKGSSNGGSSSSKLPDISRRKLRERLIHLLALKPFKKPELYSRLQNEGLRDRERGIITTILKDISTLSRDNTYNLRRQMWNDVNENWPFYTEQELQQLKRRKPQNLTPPLSSDAGSSTSGQSPTSTHTGSPPPLVGPNHGASGMGLKRASLECDRYAEESLLSGGQVKKQRISHFKKDATGTSSTTGSTSGVTTTRMGFGQGNSGIGASSTNYLQQNRNTSYSPHGVLQTTDENSGNSDLSYNVLDNVEDFMSHVEQSSYFGSSNNTNTTNTTNTGNTSNNLRKSSGSNASNAKNASDFKQKRSSGGGSSSTTSSSSYIGTAPPQERSSNKELMKKTSSISGTSPKPYCSSFVPESKSSSCGSSRGNGSAVTNNYQRQSPSNAQQQQHHKTSSSVIYSPKTHVTSTSSPREEVTQRSGSNNSRHQQAAMRSSSKSVKTPTPPPQNHQQQQPQLQQHQQPQPPSPQPPPPQQQQLSSPTQQIAAAASRFAIASDPQSYDFSNYTPIMTIEQRRQYKTEFESDYDEYRKLLTQIEGVGKRFRGLAERLENAKQGCPDYYNIKQQIVSEYERIRNEESLRRDKQRFDYLHEKLAHIKQLVMEYDKTLTSGAAIAAAAAMAAQQQQLQHQQQQQQQHPQYVHSVQAADSTNILVASRHPTRLSPMVVSGGESNHSPPLSALLPQQQHSHYQQHHDAETIQQQDQMHPSTQHQLPLQQSPTPSNNNTAQHINGHHAPHVIHKNNDSDSDDSSDSNSNDDDDDDSNSNSNDDEDDDDNEHY